MLIEIAGVPFDLHCKFESENRVFFRDYLTEKDPLFVIEPTKSDIQVVRNGFDRMADLVGEHRQEYEEAFLENNAIHLLLAEKLIEYHVLLMHGSALCMDDHAYIFTAKSGTGKSTHARLWREVFGDRVWMINDDKPMLRIEEDGVRVYGTPWNGKHRLSRNAFAPLKAIVSIEQSETNQIDRLDKVTAFSVLMNQAYYSKNRVTMLRIIELEKQLLESVAFYHLDCNMDPNAANIAWQGMNEGTSQ